MKSRQGLLLIGLTANFVGFPLARNAVRLIGGDLPYQAIDALWLVLTIFAVTAGVAPIRRALPRLSLPKYYAGLVGLAIFLAIPTLFSQAPIALPYLLEWKPIFYLAILPPWLPLARDGRALVHMPVLGAILGAILTAEGAILSLRVGSPIRALGSGEANYDALLLGIAGLVLVQQAMPVRRKTVLAAAIAAGALASMSRTGLAAFALAVAFTPGIRLGLRMALSALSAAGLASVFAARGIVAQFDQFDRLAMWEVLTSYLRQQPGSIPFGVTGLSPLPVEIPASIYWIWDQQQAEIGVGGIFPFHFHAFWARIALTWGVPLAVFLFIVVLRIAVDQPNARPLLILACIAGFTMGVFYLSIVALPLLIAIVASLDTSRRTARWLSPPGAHDG